MSTWSTTALGSDGENEHDGDGDAVVLTSDDDEPLLANLGAKRLRSMAVDNT